MMDQENSIHNSRNDCRKDSFLISDLQGYKDYYQFSIDNPKKFWRQQAECLSWDKPFNNVIEEDFSTASIAWFSDGTINASRNVLDTHIEKGNGSDTAIVCFDDQNRRQSYTYSEVRDETAALASSLEAEGFKSGDSITLYLPDCPESIFIMFACSRLGITYVPVPHYFTAVITNEIIMNSESSLLVIAPQSNNASYNERAKSVWASSGNVTVIALGELPDSPAISYADFVSRGKDNPKDAYVPVEAEHPLFILYANSSTGIPRGSVFATGGFLVQAGTSFDCIFLSGSDTEVSEVVSTHNLASAAGQCYGVWAPLLKGLTLVITADGESSSYDSLNEISKSCKAPALLTTPRLITTLKKEATEQPALDTLNFSLVACSGDVLTPLLVKYAGEALTTGSSHVINMWIQSESGAALISTFPNAELNRTGSLGLPLPGIKPVVINNMNEFCRPNESGQLIFESSWPSIIRTIRGQDDRYRELYFQRIPGNFSTNDGVRVDIEGFYWLMGRLDDVIKVRGQSLATSEIEAVLVAHSDIIQAAVVTVTGTDSDNLIAFLVIGKERLGQNYSMFESQLTDYIKQKIGEFAVPNRYVFSSELPQTRSGKIVRRILRRIASGNVSHDEDLSHIVNPNSINDLIEGS